MTTTTTLENELEQQHENAELGIFPTLEDRQVVLTRLKLLGVKTIEVHFQGGGDSGEIDGVYANTHDGFREVNLKGEIIHGWQARSDYDTTNSKWVRSIERKDMNLEELLENMTYDALEQSGHDWYNNDGGQGSMTIDFTQSPPEIRLEVGINYTSTDDHQYTL